MPNRLRVWWNKQVRSRPLRRQVILLTVCLVFSVVLWSIVALNDTYITTLSFKVDFRDLPDDVQITRRPSQPLKVTAEGIGLDLMLSSLPLSRDTIFFPFVQDARKGFLVSSNYRSTVAAGLPKKVKIRALSPDSLYFAFEQKVSRRVPLVSRVNIDLFPSYQLASPPQLEPDTVTLLGPVGALDTITRWYTRERFVTGVKENRDLTIGLVDTIEGISVFPQKAQLQIRPLRYTQTQISIPVRVTNLPEGERVRLNADSLRLTCLVPIEAYEELLAESRSFEVLVDFRSLKEGQPQIIPDLSFLPKPVKVVLREPLYLEYVRIKTS